jgi:hypothetical protein
MARVWFGRVARIRSSTSDTAALEQKADQNARATGQCVYQEVHETSMSPGQRNLKQFHRASKENGNQQPREQPSAVAQIQQRTRKREAYEMFELVRSPGETGPHNRRHQSQ